MFNTKRNLFTGELLYCGQYSSLREAVEKNKNNLQGADLQYADLRDANLQGVYLRDANLQGVYLRDADLQYADLQDANLRGANLRDADLYRADLRDANLRDADLQDANLQGAFGIIPTMILLANWGECSDELTTLLMRYDAANHPDPSRFDLWAGGDSSCPYDGINVLRAASFQEVSTLWSPGPCPRPYDLMVKLFEENGVKF